MPLAPQVCPEDDVEARHHQTGDEHLCPCGLEPVQQVVCGIHAAGIQYRHDTRDDSQGSLKDQLTGRPDSVLLGDLYNRCASKPGPGDHGSDHARHENRRKGADPERAEHFLE